MHTATDFAQADTQPVTPPQAVAVQAPTRFDALTRCGILSLYIEGAPPAHAAEAALLLDRCDALLDGLDAWLHAALDWRWVPAPRDDEAPRACATARCTIEADGSTSPLICRLELPWPLMRGIGAPADALAGRLHWSAVPAVLVISQPAIAEAELRLLERGGAVVLPESMRAPWLGRLRAPDEKAGDGMSVELSPESAQPATHPNLSAATPSSTLGQPFCEVRMTATRPLEPAQLAGWAHGSAIELAPRASLWRCAGPTEPERYLAGGRLLPWGDGWAMLIESV